MIRLATIGTSAITKSLLEALNQVEGVEFVGTLSRDAERAASFTAEHGGTCPFTSLDELASSDDVDAVYIGSPNALHCPQALACIAGGKHVLVEKPFCANERQAREVFAAAEAAGVIALEAMRPLHDPAFHALKDAIAEIGTVRRATLRFGKYSSRYDEILAGRRTNIFDCAMSSGSLMDIGIYTVEPLIELFGTPQHVSASAVLLDEQTRELTGGPIDGAGVIMATYPGMIATLHHSKITNDLAHSQIEGELGTLTVEGISSPSAAQLDLRVASTDGDSVGYSSAQTSTRTIELPHSDNTMTYELADFVQAIESVRDGSSPLDAAAGPFGTVERFRDITLSSLALMDEARHQTGVSFPADNLIAR
ncbi:MAG: Gfo/Idh/MocA family oxidoreductase [Coriobacteriaceae bacterium]|nr:Gfo/Idh/MocA family oxidoreductase [Coriobacteriaceae bacterium]